MCVPPTPIEFRIASVPGYQIQKDIRALNPFNVCSVRPFEGDVGVGLFGVLLSMLKQRVQLGMPDQRTIPKEQWE